MLLTDSGILGDCPKFWPIRIPWSLLNDPMIDTVYIYPYEPMWKTVAQQIRVFSSFKNIQISQAKTDTELMREVKTKVQDEKTRCGYIPSFTLFLFCCLCLCGLLTTSRMSGICILLCTGHRIKPGRTDVRHMLLLNQGLQYSPLLLNAASEDGLVFSESCLQ